MSCNRLRSRLGSWILIGGFGTACGGDSPTEPIELPYGETSLVVVMNPVVNDVNAAAIPAPGAAQSGVSVSLAGGPSGTTDASGVAALSPVPAGQRTLSASAGGTSGTLNLDIIDRDLREIAVSLTSGGAGLMADVRYAFGGQVVEVTPAMSVAAVNAELARSNIVVFFRAGTYSGNLVIAGSDATLFGEGTQGGAVTLDGNVTVSGSRSRIRGARITGSLTVPGSDFGMSFSRVAGAVQIAGSNAKLLRNAFCSTVNIPGSGATALGNAGLAPLPQPAGGC